MQSKLGLDYQKISHAKQIAKNIAGDVQNFVDGYTTVTVERTVCRLLGIDGVDANGVPLPNVVVDHLKNNGILGEGIMFWLGNTMINTGLTTQEIAESIAQDKLDISRQKINSRSEIEAVLQPIINKTIKRITKRQRDRKSVV